jgi:KDO2-lipid IV(A) lauroyltransferase
VSKQRSAIRNRAEFAAYRVTRGAVGLLGARGVARVGEVLGDLFLVVGSRRREVLDFNIELIYPEMTTDRRRSFAREVARHFGRVSLDTLRLQRLEPDELLREVDIVGYEHAAAAAGRGRGIIYLSAHLGLWEVAGLAGGLVRPETILAVNRPLDNPLLEEELNRLRGRFGNVPLGKRNILRTILRHLADRGAVGFLIDQRVSPDVGVEVPFFDQPTWTHPILARVVRKTRAPVVPVCALWEGPGRYSMRLFEPIFPDELAEEERNDVSLTARFSAITARMIRQRPEQWLWFHDRWRELRLAKNSSNG